MKLKPRGACAQQLSEAQLMRRYETLPPTPLPHPGDTCGPDTSAGWPTLPRPVSATPENPGAASILQKPPVTHQILSSRCIFGRARRLAPWLWPHFTEGGSKLTNLMSQEPLVTMVTRLSRLISELGSSPWISEEAGGGLWLREHRFQSAIFCLPFTLGIDCSP